MNISKCYRLFASGLMILMMSTPLYAAYPDKPITLIVAWGAGGATDAMARAVQPILAKKLGADIVIKNISGASGTIGTAEAANAQPDGYTLLFSASGTLTTQPHLRTLPYSVDSFEAIGRVAVVSMVTVVTKDSKFNSINDVIAQVKANPGKLKMASTGAGTIPHLAILSLSKAADIKPGHVPYTSAALAVKAMMGGEVEVFSDQSQIVSQFDLKPLAAWSGKRLKEFPDLPTMKELGFDIEISNWVGLFAPKGTPQAIVDKLATALQQTVEDPALIESMSKLKVQVDFLTLKDFSAYVKNESNKNESLLKEAGIIKQQ